MARPPTIPNPPEEYARGAFDQIFRDINNYLIRLNNDVTYAATVGNTVTTLTIVAGVVTVDCARGDYFRLVLTANVTSIVFINVATANVGMTKWIEFVQGAGPYTVAWPASFKWEGGTLSNVSTANGAVDEMGLTSLDQGTTWKVTLAKAWS